MGKYTSFLLIAASAALWGGIAFFVRGLSELGFTSMEIVTIRVAVATIFLGAAGVLKWRGDMAIHIRDTWLFAGTGIVSIAFFNWCYFTSLGSMDVSLAVILLYTSPVFVSILSYVFFKERFTAVKIFAVAGTFFGSVMVAGSVSGAEEIGALDFLIGLGAGLGYALYSIFGKAALRKYKPFTITFYTFLTASLFLLPLTGLWKKAGMLVDPAAILYGVGLGLIPTVLAYFLYTKGLEKIDSSTAAIIATVEPVVATMMGVFLYDETMGMLQLAGSVIILASVTIANLQKDILKQTKKRLQSM